MKTKYGSLYSFLDYRKKQNLYFNLVFIFRKIFISVNSVYLLRYSGIQFIVLLYLNFLILIFIGQYRPMVDRFNNWVELIYEYFIGLSTIVLVSFTQFVSNPQTRYTAGWISLGIFSSHVLFAVSINLFQILYILGMYIKRTCIKYNKWYRLYEQKKKEKEKKKRQDPSADMTVNIFNLENQNPYVSKRQQMLIKYMLEKYENQITSL